MKFEIYSKEGCDYCERAKNTLKIRNIPYIEHKLSDTVTKEMIQERVGDVKKINVVPQIFMDDSYLGGYIDLIELLAKRVDI